MFPDHVKLYLAEPMSYETLRVSRATPKAATVKPEDFRCYGTTRQRDSVRHTASEMSTLTHIFHLRPRSSAPPLIGIRAGTFALVSLFTLVWLISLSRSVFDPIGFDQALYQYITDRVILGQRLYTDVWDQNSPGIVGIHWLATVLVGRTPIALRVFDAIWQCATIAALVALATRDGRRWQIGWLAATLYVLAYYGLGYVHTAQREGFAVLPLLLAAHALAPVRTPVWSLKNLGMRHCLAGMLCFVAFAIKPPLGLCFGALWLLAMADLLKTTLFVGAACSRDYRRSPAPIGHSAPTLPGGKMKGNHSSIPAARTVARSDRTLAGMAVLSLSAGFILSALAAIALLMHLGWWDGFWRVLTRKDIAGYIRGPQLVRELAPHLLAGTVALAIVILVACMGRTRSVAGATLHIRSLAAPIAAGLAVFALVLTVQRWPDWQQAFLKTAGLLIPAAGAMLAARWSQRSRTWQIAVLLALASFAAILWQGHFALYQFPPLLAFAAYVAAVELTERLARFTETDTAGRIWMMVSVGFASHLAVSTWGWTMSYYGRSPYVLSGTTLAGHYTKVTANKPSFPTYETTAMAAARVRELTSDNDPIVCLIDEPRLYYLAQRPPAHPLLRTQECYSTFFPGLFETIRSRQPKVLLARLPAELRGTTDPAAAEPAVLADLDRYFGPPAHALHGQYRLTEIINADVCILQPSALVLPQ
jgi:hypothetical protein